MLVISGDQEQYGVGSTTAAQRPAERLITVNNRVSERQGAGNEKESPDQLLYRSPQCTLSIVCHSLAG